MVLRRVSQDIPEMKTLGLPEKLQELALAPRGLLILAGPTGSGKSTTMASMLNYRNQKLPGHIVTIEDPIEFISKTITKSKMMGFTRLWNILEFCLLKKSLSVVTIILTRLKPSII